MGWGRSKIDITYMRNYTYRDPQLTGGEQTIDCNVVNTDLASESRIPSSNAAIINPYTRLRLDRPST